MKRVNYILLLVVIAFCQCAKDPVDLTGSLFGTITDSETKEPIKGASVVLTPGGDSKTTGSDGKFEFDKLDANTYAVTASCSNYETDIKEAIVVAGKAAQLDFSLSSILPELNINVSALDFGSDKSQLSFDISNAGKGTLEWEIISDVSWISSISPKSGETTTNTSTVIISIDRTGLNTGDYTSNIIVSSNVGSEEISVTQSVSGANFEVSPLDVDFGSVNTTEQITLQNTTGIGNVIYTIEKSADWLSIDKTTGTLTEKSPTAVINIVADRSGLSAGEFNDKIVIKSDVASDITCTVKMNVLVNQIPTVSIGTASDITYNSASIEATVVSLGSHAVTKHGLCWSQSSEPTIDDDYSNLGNKSEIGKYTGILSNLESETKYYVRAYATNDIGTAYSSDYSFTTLGTPIISTVITTSATSVESTTATVNGSIENVGNSIIEEYGFIYNTDDNLSTTSGNNLNLGSKGTEIGDFSGNISELQVATRYYFRAYAINEVGVSYGDVLSFTTLIEDPTITTIDASGITHSKATSGGEITYTGGNIFTERGVCWSETATSPTVNDNCAISSDETTSFSAELTDLETTTSYYVRAYVRTSDNLYYGDVKQFVTTEFREEPTVETNEVTDISIDCATVYCYIPSDGGSTVTARGVCWSTTPGATTSNNIVSCGSGSGNYTANITGLLMGQTVYVKAYATNEVGTAYGEELSFTTRSSNVIYVSKTNGSDTNNGDSWSTAYATITKATENAPSGFQVWVDNATYSNEGITMKEGVDVYGGFEGNETELSQRSSESYTPLLRQVILQETNFSTKTIVDGFKVLNCSDATAVTLLNNGVGSNLWVDNCTSSTVYVYGGMMANCYIKNNTAPYMIEAINSEITNCEVSDNSCSTSCIAATNSTIENCLIHNNIITGGNGNVISSTGSIVANSKIYNCSFTSYLQSNYAHSIIEVNSSTTTSQLMGLVISENTLYAYIWDQSIIDVNKGATLELYNTSIINNSDKSSGSLDEGIFMYAPSGSSVTMANCVLWNSSNSSYPVAKTVDCDSNNVYITNCAFIDGFDGGTNIVTLTDETGSKSPMFNDDYTLQSGSPLINAGDNSFLSSSYTTDLKGDTRIQNGRVDIGAYEYNY